jgi:hypothetical protein
MAESWNNKWSRHHRIDSMVKFSTCPWIRLKYEMVTSEVFQVMIQSGSLEISEEVTDAGGRECTCASTPRIERM